MIFVRELVPARARLWIYAVYVLSGLVVGSVTVATGGLDWTAAAERVLAYLAVPLAVLAGVNVGTSTTAPGAGGWGVEDDPYFAAEEAARYDASPETLAEIDRQMEG